MTLEDLVKHVPAQTTKIKQLIDRHDRFSNIGSAWAAFRGSLWGERLGSLEENQPLSNATRSTRPVVEVPATFPGIDLMGSPKILVRSEYEEAEQAVLLANADDVDAFIVTGIGPPLSFLIFIHRS